MTTEERIMIIKNRAQKNIDDEMKRLDDEMKRLNKLEECISEMTDRIKTIITLANTCLESGIKIPETKFSQSYDAGKKYGYPHEFIAEGIRHHTGLIRPNRTSNRYKYIGIENGGACGRYDFWTDGNDIWAVHECNRNDKQPARERDMEQFIKEFPVFEEAFLNFIDSLA